MNDATVPVLGAPRTHRSNLQRAWDRLSLYLPVLLMMLLALASYLLLQATPEPPKPEPVRPVTHDADYFMRRFSVKTYADDGKLTSEIYGAEAHHYPDTDTVVVDNARMRAFNQFGQLSTATALEITVNGEGTEVEMRGQAVVVRQAGRTKAGQRISRMEFHGEHLFVGTNPEFVKSDLPVLLIRGPDQMTADTLDYRGEGGRVVELTGKVRAKLVSKLDR